MVGDLCGTARDKIKKRLALFVRIGSRSIRFFDANILTRGCILSRLITGLRWAITQLVDSIDEETIKLELIRMNNPSRKDGGNQELPFDWLIRLVGAGG